MCPCNQQWGNINQPASPALLQDTLGILKEGDPNPIAELALLAQSEMYPMWRYIYIYIYTHTL